MFDWSNEELIRIPEPEFARVNIIADFNLSKITHKIGLDGFEPGVNCKLPAKLEFWDMSGNYFKLPIIISTQGSSSQLWTIKNLGFDFDKLTNSNKEKYTPEVKFGNWPAIDSFHIKKYYIDVFRGNCIIGYQLAEQILSSRPWSQRRGYSYLLNDIESNSNCDISLDFNDSAKCHPYGFPIELYFNGELKNIYVWSFKKHRSNYNMKKDETSKIIIDGVTSSIWSGNINWKAFELKNPKKLYYKAYSQLIDEDFFVGQKYLKSAKWAIDNGYIKKKKTVNGEDYYEYDGNFADEIVSDPNVDETSAQIHAYISSLSEYKNWDKETMNQKLNIPLFIDYWIFSEFTFNQDGLGNNILYTSYDLEKLNPNYYDLDCIFGADWSGKYFENSLNNLGPQNIFVKLKSMYIDEIKQRYTELRKLGILTTNNVINLYLKWINRIGYENLKKDIEMMQSTNNDSSYSYPKNNEKFHNSIGRLEKWLDTKLQNLDNYYEYKNI